MAEVNQGFEAAMRRGREFGASGDWAKALTEYVRAAQLAPADISARYSLAVALSRLGRDEQAMQQFQGIVRAQPQHTEAWQRIAEAQARAGQTAEAVQIYRRIQEIHQKHDRNREAAEILREIIRVDPGQVNAYRELMDIAKARGDRKTAANLAVALGRYYQSQGRTKDAVSAVNEALVLQPGLPEAETLRETLSGPALEAPLPVPAPNGAMPNGASLAPTTSSSPPAAMVATISASQYTVNNLIAAAEESLGRGDTGLALRNYEMAVEAGADRSDVYYSLGNLYAEAGQIDRATDYLRRSTADTEYAASAFFGMGQLYAGADRLDEASQAFQDALNLIDLQTIGKDEVNELVDMYDALGDVLARQGKVQENFDLYNRLAGYINSRNLRTEKTAMVLIRVRELSEKLQAALPQEAQVDEHDQPLVTGSIRFGEDGLTITGTGPMSEENPALQETNTGTLPPIGTFAGSNSRTGAAVPTIATFPPRFPSELLAMESYPPAQPYLRAAEEFTRTGRYNAAVDACQEMIRYYPDFLPAHVILAEIYIALDRLEQARLKYQFVVDVYGLRQEPLKSLECYKRLGEISPENAGLRAKLAKMLLQYDQKEAAAEVLLSTISNYVRTGQLERALEECRVLKASAPQSAPVRIQYAELLNRMERYNESLPELGRALELDPDNLRALALFNITSFLLNDPALRWNSFQTVVERARQNEANLRQFLEEYRQAVFLNNQAGLQYALGCLYLENKAFKQAEHAFGLAVEAPQHERYEPLIHWSLGQLYFDQGRAEGAIAELTKAVTAFDQADPAHYASSQAPYGSLPSQTTIYRKLAQAFGAQGQPAQAVKALKMVKKLLPYNRGVHTELAELYFNQGQLTEALGELGELVAHYEETNQVDATIDVLKEMVGLAPNNIGVRDKLSEVYLKRGMIDDGLKQLDELAELQRKNGRLKDAVRTLQRAAETYRMMGKMETGYELYDKIVRISPGDVEARQQLVNWHLMSGRYSEAVEEQRTIAQICLQSNNHQEAVAALHQVIGLVPEDIRAYFQLAGVLTSLNEHTQAFRLYQRVLRLDPANEKAKNLMEQSQRRATEAGQKV